MTLYRIIWTKTGDILGEVIAESPEAACDLLGESVECARAALAANGDTGRVWLAMGLVEVRDMGVAMIAKGGEA